MLDLLNYVKPKAHTESSEVDPNAFAKKANLVEVVRRDAFGNPYTVTKKRTLEVRRRKVDKIIPWVGI